MRILLTALLMSAVFAGSAWAESFRFIRIGDKDGFGFASTKGLVRGHYQFINAPPADSNGNGRLDPGEFLPDLNKDGRVAYFAFDEFDNRLPAEVLDRAKVCRGCFFINGGTKGSNWTDLGLSTAAVGKNWLVENGPELPNRRCLFLISL